MENSELRDFDNLRTKSRIEVGRFSSQFRKNIQQNL